MLRIMSKYFTKKSHAVNNKAMTIQVKPKTANDQIKEAEVETATRGKTNPHRNMYELMLEDLLSPLFSVTCFVGHVNFKRRHYFGLPLWVLNIIIHFMLDFYESMHIFGEAWATCIGVFFFCFTLGSYFLCRHTLPFLKSGLRELLEDGNFEETINSMRTIIKRLPYIILLVALGGACGQYTCYHIDGATELSFKEAGWAIPSWLVIVLNILRFTSLYHILVCYTLFLVVPGTIILLTGFAMKEFQVLMANEFQEKMVDLMFRESLVLFDKRVDFIKRASKSCLVILTVLVFTSSLSFMLNAYNFLFYKRLAIYLWFSLVPLVWTTITVVLAAWATDTYQNFTMLVISTWVKRPENDGIEQECEPEPVPVTPPIDPSKRRQSEVQRTASFLFASTMLLSNFHKRRKFVLKKEGRRSSWVSSVSENVSPARKRWDRLSKSTGCSPMGLIDIERSTVIRNHGSSLNDVREEEPEYLTVSSAVSNSPQVDIPKLTLKTPSDSAQLEVDQSTSQTGLPYRNFDFQMYFTYVQNVLPQVGFSISGVLLTWEKVSGLALFLSSLLAIFVQEILFGSRKSTIST